MLSLPTIATLKNIRVSFNSETLLNILLALSLSYLVHFRTLTPYGLSELTFIVILMLTVIRKNKIIKESLFIIVPCLFSAGIFIASISLQNPSISAFRYGIIVLYNVSLFFLVANALSLICFKHLRIFIIISSLVSLLTVISLLLFYTGSYFMNDLLFVRGIYARGQGFLTNPNYYSMGMLFSFFIAFKYWQNFNKGGIFVLFILAGTLSSLSRGVMLALFVFLLVILLKNSEVRRKIRKGLYIIAISVFLLSMYLSVNFDMINFSNVIKNRFSDSGGGAQYRITAIDESLIILESGNYLFGVGRMDPLTGTRWKMIPHNSFVTSILDFGLIGALSFILFLIFMFYYSLNIFGYDSLPLAVFIALIFIALTNDYQLIKEWWMSFAIIFNRSQFQ